MRRPLSGQAKRRRQRRRGERSEAKAVQVCMAKAGKKSRQDGTESCSSRAGGGGEDHRNGSDNYLRGRRAAIFSLNKHQAFPLEGARDSAPSVPVARGREATRGKLHSARSCLSVRPAYRGVCVHAATSSKSCISGCVLLPHTCYGLSALNLSPEAPLHIAERISQRG